MSSWLVIFTLLAGIGFYNFHDLLGLPIRRAMFLLMVFVCLVYAFRMKSGKLRNSSFPRLPWFIFGCGLIVSVFMASFYHPQLLLESIMAQSTSIAAYAFFFILLILNPNPATLIKYLFVLSSVSILVYFANLATFPNNMFGEPIINDISRGMLRISIPLLQVILLLIFYSINQWQLSKSWKWIIPIGIGLLMVMLSLIRQVMAIMAILCFFQILYKYPIWKKVLIGGALLLLGYTLFVNLTIFKELKDLSEEQVDATVSEEKEDVRIGAWRFYAYEGNEEAATFLFGNGTPSLGKSVWGKHLDSFTEEESCYIADVSWAGCVFMYGIIATIALVFIVFLAIFKRKRPDQQYLTYFMICVLLQGIASGVWFYYFEVVVTMIALYLIYRPEYEDETDNIVNIMAPSKGARLRKFVTE